LNDNLSHIASEIVNNTLYLPSCHSTNTYASDFIKENEVTNGWTVYTLDQTNGRGQKGNVWESEPNKNLTFSMVLKPEFLNPQDQFQLNMAISLAIIHFLADLGLKAEIKWPNDIFVNDRKIAGILIENQLRGNLFKVAVVGIGLNVNQQGFRTQGATSVFLQNGKKFDLVQSLGYIQTILFRYVERLRTGEFEWIKKEYHSKLYLRNKPSIFKRGDNSFVGSIKGVNEFGMLQIQTENGLLSFGLKEIKFPTNYLS
jgi:BirA family transcriptional regulator, biotin operon repressor / biotin---[acetyl-CoA-carboxylase] ligase